MVKDILTLAKEDYSAAVTKYTKRVVDRVLAGEKAAVEVPEVKAPEVKENSPAQTITEKNMKNILVDPIDKEQLSEIIFLLTGDKDSVLIKRQISNLLRDGISVSDIGRTVYYMYKIEELDYIRKYGIGVVPTYLAPAVEMFERESARIERMREQGRKLKGFQPNKIKMNYSKENEPNKRTGVNLIDISAL